MSTGWVGRYQARRILLNSYKDIRSLIDFEPLWWDEHGCPRYCKFRPQETANIYADEAVLLLIECQYCGREFPVCLSRAASFAAIRGDSAASLAALIGSAEIHYGDPPNIGCCPAGPTMNSVPLRVLEYWRRHRATVTGWFRVEELEINVAPMM